jgi:homoserine O-succinyltransferase
MLPQKHSGVFPHRLLQTTALTAGFDDKFNVPVSRNTEVRREDIAHIPCLDILAESDQTGLCLLEDSAARRVFMFNHLEYDADTLKREYDRDVKAGIDPQVPFGYFPEDNPANAPAVTWRAHRNLLFHNWINAVYQGTPYKLDDLPQTRAPRLCDRAPAP